MPTELKAMIPDHEILLSLTPEELAGKLLVILSERQGQLSCHRFVNGLYQLDEVYPRELSDNIGVAIAEAWGWLLTQGLLVTAPRDTSLDAVLVSRRGREVVQQGNFESYLKATHLPKEILHPLIAKKAWPNFIRGDYDTAVFQAFKEVEVAVREVGGFDQRQIGVPLMREAFHKERGPLSDASLPEAEREALAALFAGAIGSYKNPSSHRTVTIEEPLEAGEMLILASHLLRIVEDRKAKRVSGYE